MQLHSDQPTRHTTLHPYTPILHRAARLVKSLKPRDHIIPALRHATPLASHQSANFIQNLCPRTQLNTSSCSTSIPGHLHVTYMSSLVTPCTKVESRSSLRSSAKGDYLTQRTSSSFGRRAVRAVVGPSEMEQSTRLPPSRRLRATIYRINQNQTTKSSFFKFITDNV